MTKLVEHIAAKRKTSKMDFSSQGQNSSKVKTRQCCTEKARKDYNLTHNINIDDVKKLKKDFHQEIWSHPDRFKHIDAKLNE